MAGAVAQVLSLPGLWLYAVANIVLTVAVAVILTATGSWRKVGFRAPRRRRDLLYFLVSFLPVIINVVPGLQFTRAASVTGPDTARTDGRVRRGINVPRSDAHRTARTREWRAIIVTSVLFGVTHLANVLAGANVLETISQVVYTIAFGVAFAALAIRTGIIWPLVLAHDAIERPTSFSRRDSCSPRPGR